MEISEIRTFDGSNNNETNPEWGGANTWLLRFTQASYYGGKDELAAPHRENPRVISNVVCQQDKLKPNQRGLSDYMWAWGQFLDHEIDLTESAEPREDASFSTPANDPVLKKGTVPFSRSVFDPATGTTANNPRQQINQISAYLDATNVYGSNATRAAALRRFDGSGKLKTSTNDLLPFNLAGLPNAMLPGSNPVDLFVAGDVRSNEHGVLTSMHTLFLREHNRQCDLIIEADPDLEGDDEAIYQRARRIVGAIMQVITYNEFLPALLGDNAISHYTGYNPAVDAGISNLFSTACYRLGHSMLSPTIVLPGEDPIALRELFFNPQLIISKGIDPFLAGLAQQVMQEIDVKIVDDVRSFLFNAVDPDNKMLLDLPALNMQRARDHGLPDYNRCRIDLGLQPKTKFSEITSDKKIQQDLKKVYKDVNDIDPWLGGLAEDHVEGANVGELIFTVLKDQFERMRDGDRFWYKNDEAFSDDEIEQLEQTRLSDIILANTGITDIQENVFFSSVMAGPCEQEEEAEMSETE